MKKTLLLSALFVFAFAASSIAQFEGTITYKLQEVDGGEEQFTTYFTSERIFVQGDEPMSMAGSFKAKGLLIRLDKKDFVFLTGDKTAMSITKTGLTSFMNMFNEMGKRSSSRAGKSGKDFTFKKMDETKSVKGYETQKFVLQPKDNDQKKAVIWMTKQIDINWGMLAKPWGDSASFIINKNFPSEYVFQQGWVPLKGTFYKEGEKSGNMTAHVEETAVSKKRVQLSSDIQVKNLSEYLFQMMRNKN